MGKTYEFVRDFAYSASDIVDTLTDVMATAIMALGLDPNDPEFDAIFNAIDTAATESDRNTLRPQLALALIID